MVAWVAREGSWIVQEEEVNMGEIRRWSVEAKEFEISIKGGLMGVRLVEKRNNRQRSVWVHRDEISWLVGAVEKAANVKSPVNIFLSSLSSQPSPTARL
jgi:hypothetical protein